MRNLMRYPAVIAGGGVRTGQLSPVGTAFRSFSALSVSMVRSFPPVVSHDDRDDDVGDAAPPSSSQTAQKRHSVFIKPVNVQYKSAAFNDLCYSWKRRYFTTFNTKYPGILNDGLRRNIGSTMYFIDAHIQANREQMEDLTQFDLDILQVGKDFQQENLHQSLLKDPSKRKPRLPTTAVFSVYDGHVGFESCLFLKRNLLRNLLLEEGSAITDHAQFLSSDERIATAFLKTDWSMHPVRYKKGGSTALVVMIKESIDGESYEIICANVGDCKAVLFDGEKIVPLSHEHKPNIPQEKQRIEQAGYKVSVTGRVDGLNISRVFGDMNWKEERTDESQEPRKRAITAEPEIIRHTLHLNHSNELRHKQFIVMGSDGMWSENTEEGAVDVVRLNGVRSKSAISLLDNQHDDNASVILIDFNFDPAGG